MGEYKIHFNKDGRYCCSLCDFSRFTLSDLYLHYRNVHKGKDNPLQNLPDQPDGTNLEKHDETDKVSPTDEGIKHAAYRGIQYTFNPVLRKYQCGHCGTQINCRNYLLQHIRTSHLCKTLVVRLFLNNQRRKFKPSKFFSQCKRRTLFVKRVANLSLRMCI